MIDLERLIEQARELAPLPASAARLAELIELGQALTLKLLRAANSAPSPFPATRKRVAAIRPFEVT